MWIERLKYSVGIALFRRQQQRQREIVQPIIFNIYTEV
jgi:hypothetical protein